MHKIHAKEFTLDDFSHEHLIWGYLKEDSACYVYGEIDEPYSPKDILDGVISSLNACREAYLNTKDKRYWWQMIQLLPQSYNQKATVTMNYENVRNMYFARKAHKLDEWSEGFVKWVKTLPYAEELICFEGKGVEVC